MLWGIIAGLIAGALWGYSFLAPKITPEASSAAVALGRFAAYGIVSALHLVLVARTVRTKIDRRAVGALLGLGALGYGLYYGVLVQGIRWAGIPASSLLIGLLPLTVAWAGAGFRWRPSFLLPFALILAGAGTLAFQMYAQRGGEGAVSGELQLVGVALTLLALALWTWFAVANGKFLKSRPELSGGLWSSCLGVGALLSFLPVFFVDGWVQGRSLGGELGTLLSSPRFLVSSLILGLGGSWLASLLWNIASRRLPTSATGYLIVSETVFALLYGFVWEGRWPTFLEGVATLLLVAGVFCGLRAFQRPTV